MKISESTSYPHPILAPWSNDISDAKIETTISFRENELNNQLSIHCSVSMDQPDIVELIGRGLATFGCFIKCQETGFRRLQRIGFPVGTHEFAPGALLGRVEVRPIVWASREISSYNPTGAHAEFDGPTAIEVGQILALDDEQVIEVTRPPLAPIETIFEISSSDEIPEGRFEINTELPKIMISMSKKTYQLVQQLRQTDDDTRSVVMNALYMPVIMHVLEQLSETKYEPFEQYRWLSPFKARCELTGINLEKIDLINDAQRLLSQPFATLSRLVAFEGEAL